MRIANFNVQNLRLRRTPRGPALDGAVDRDMHLRPDPALDVLDRRLTAAVLTSIDADIVALEEVFDLAALDFFHDRYLVPGGARPYPHRVCLPGNDGQGMNIALMSRTPPVAVTSHAALTAAEVGLDHVPEKLRTGPIFRRDCLEVELPRLTLFICHFKAPYPDPDEARDVREAEAMAVRRLIERRFPNPAAAHWLVIGDLNEPDAGDPRSALAPLTRGFAIDLLARLAQGDDWTFAQPGTGTHTRPDALIASPALVDANPNARPQIFRVGMESARPHASDHAAVYVDFPDL